MLTGPRPCNEQDCLYWIGLLRTPSNWVLNDSKDGTLKTSLAKPLCVSGHIHCEKLPYIWSKLTLLPFKPSLLALIAPGPTKLSIPIILVGFFLSALEGFWNFQKIKFWNFQKKKKKIDKALDLFKKQDCHALNSMVVSLKARGSIWRRYLAFSREWGHWEILQRFILTHIKMFPSRYKK